MAPASRSKNAKKEHEDEGVRGRILDAAFTAFMQKGYTAASTIEIATQARVSKRELYALVGNKQEMLVACISARAHRLQAPANLPVPQDRESLTEILSIFGAQLLREVSDPTVIAVFRLAIAESTQAPEVARTLDSIGRGSGRAAMQKIFTQAIESKLISGRSAELGDQFLGLLWGGLMTGLLLGVAERPKPREITKRARDAANALLLLHPAPDTAT